jgi:hypothetical protein
MSSSEERVTEFGRLKAEQGRIQGQMDTDPEYMDRILEKTTEEVLSVSDLTLLRIYDVLMALLKETNADVARDLLEAHLTGLILGPTPNFNGEFITDKLNP